MKEASLKSALAWIFLVGHLGTFVLLIVLRQAGGFTDDELKICAGFILPIFAGFTTMIIKDAIGNRNNFSKAKPVIVTNQFAGIALGFGIFFVLLAPALIIAMAGNYISSFNTFMIYLTITQTSLATYLSLIIDALYGAHETNKKMPRPTK